MREMLEFDSSLWTLVNFLFSLTRSYHTMLFIADEKKGFVPRLLRRKNVKYRMYWLRLIFRCSGSCLPDIHYVALLKILQRPKCT